MRINELISEAGPAGTKQNAFMGAINSFANSLEIRNAVRDAYRYWIDYVGKVARQQNPNFDVTQAPMYIKLLQLWMAKRLTLPNDDPIIVQLGTDISNSINPDSPNDIGKGPVIRAMSNALQAAQSSPNTHKEFGVRPDAEIQDIINTVVPQVAMALQTNQNKLLRDPDFATAYNTFIVHSPNIKDKAAIFDKIVTYMKTKASGKNSVLKQKNKQNTQTTQANNSNKPAAGTAPRAADMRVPYGNDEWKFANGRWVSASTGQPADGTEVAAIKSILQKNQNIRKK